MVRIIKLIFILFVMVIAIAFAVMNEGMVNLNYYFGSRELPLSVVVVGALALGALMGFLASMGGNLRLRRENATLKHKSHLAAQEVNNLRAIPIKDN